MHMWRASQAQGQGQGQGSPSDISVCVKVHKRVVQIRTPRHFTLAQIKNQIYTQIQTELDVRVEIGGFTLKTDNEEDESDMQVKLADLIPHNSDSVILIAKQVTIALTHPPGPLRIQLDRGNSKETVVMTQLLDTEALLSKCGFVVPGMLLVKVGRLEITRGTELEEIRKYLEDNSSRPQEVIFADANDKSGETVLTSKNKLMPLTLFVEVIRAQNLKVADVVSSDPYVKVYVGNEFIGRTEVVYRNLSPVWKKRFNIPLLTCQTTVSFQLFDEDQFSQDDELGNVDVQLDTLVAGEPLEEWYAIQNGAGRLQLKLLLTSRRIINVNAVAAFPRIQPSLCLPEVGTIFQLYNTSEPVREFFDELTITPKDLSFLSDILRDVASLRCPLPINEQEIPGSKCLEYPYDSRSDRRVLTLEMLTGASVMGVGGVAAALEGSVLQDNSIRIWLKDGSDLLFVAPDEYTYWRFILQLKRMADVTANSNVEVEFSGKMKKRRDKGVLRTGGFEFNERCVELDDKSQSIIYFTDSLPRQAQRSVNQLFWGEEKIRRRNLPLDTIFSIELSKDHVDAGAFVVDVAIEAASIPARYGDHTSVYAEIRTRDQEGRTAVLKGRAPFWNHQVHFAVKEEDMIGNGGITLYLYASRVGSLTHELVGEKFVSFSSQLFPAPYDAQQETCHEIQLSSLRRQFKLIVCAAYGLTGSERDTSPYCKVSCIRVGAKNMETWYTDIKSRTTSPTWDELIVLGSNLASADEISFVRIEIYSKSQIKADTPLGYVDVSYQDFVVTEIQHVYPIHSLTGRTDMDLGHLKVRTQLIVSSKGFAGRTRVGDVVGTNVDVHCSEAGGVGSEFMSGIENFGPASPSSSQTAQRKAAQEGPSSDGIDVAVIRIRCKVESYDEFSSKWPAHTLCADGFEHVKVCVCAEGFIIDTHMTTYKRSSSAIEEFCAQTPGGRVMAEIFENERYHLVYGWGPYLLPHDRSRFSDDHGELTASLTDNLDELSPGAGFEWLDEWHVDTTYTRTDVYGWSYGFDHKGIRENMENNCSKIAPDVGIFCRRRKWVREMVRNIVVSGTTSETSLGDIGHRGHPDEKDIEISSHQQSVDSVMARTAELHPDTPPQLSDGLRPFVCIEGNDCVSVRVYENERKVWWKEYCPENLLPSDRRRFTDETGRHSVIHLQDIPAPPLHSFVGEWSVVTNTSHTDRAGWSYSIDFWKLELNDRNGDGKPEDTLYHFVRRRVWERRLTYTPLLDHRNTAVSTSNCFGRGDAEKVPSENEAQSKSLAQTEANILLHRCRESVPQHQLIVLDYSKIKQVQVVTPSTLCITVTIGKRISIMASSILASDAQYRDVDVDLLVGPCPASRLGSLVLERQSFAKYRTYVKDVMSLAGYSGATHTLAGENGTQMPTAGTTIEAASKALAQLESAIASFENILGHPREGGMRHTTEQDMAEIEVLSRRVIRLRVYIHELFAMRLKSQLFENVEHIVNSDVQNVIAEVDAQADDADGRQTVDVAIQKLDAMMEGLEFRVREICVCGWEHRGALGTTLEAVINPFYVQAVTILGRYVQTKEAFERLQGQDTKMRLIEEFIFKDDEMHQRVSRSLALYGLKTHPKLLFSNTLDFDALLGWYSVLLEKEMCNWVDRTVTANMKSQRDRGDSVQRWEVVRLDSGLCISTLPEDVTTALQTYIHEMTNDSLAEYLGDEGLQRFIQYQSKIMSSVAGAFAHLSVTHLEDAIAVNHWKGWVGDDADDKIRRHTEFLCACVNDCTRVCTHHMISFQKNMAKEDVDMIAEKYRATAILGIKKLVEIVFHPVVEFVDHDGFRRKWFSDREERGPVARVLHTVSECLDFFRAILEPPSYDKFVSLCLHELLVTYFMNISSAAEQSKLVPSRQFNQQDMAQIRRDFQLMEQFAKKSKSASAIAMLLNIPNWTITLLTSPTDGSDQTLQTTVDSMWLEDPGNVRSMRRFLEACLLVRPDCPNARDLTRQLTRTEDDDPPSFNTDTIDAQVHADPQKISVIARVFSPRSREDREAEQSFRAQIFKTPRRPSAVQETSRPSRYTLVVHVLRGERLTNKELIGKSDPFCKFRVGPNTDGTYTEQTTKEVKSSLDPEWNETLRFRIESIAGKTLRLEVFDHNNFRQHISMGEAQVSLAGIDVSSRTETIQLQGSGGGTVHLILSLEEGGISV